MSNPGDKRSQEPARPATPAEDSQTDKRSGRIAYDERGNSIWEWQLETGVYSRDISTQRLKKLDLNDLSIADTAIQQRPPDLGGFNPYDNSSSTRGNVGKNDPYNGGNRAPLKPAAEPKRKPTDLKKLQEWMELRKRVEQNKRDDDE
ncbi:hypothetical protein GCM10011487_05420 [Steroidobacter agaridevorans]|uniref:Uncharacterized protein n=1 Tax=Steroidobacter agaridevorans TaxID=2695856 RepID=A0A829Y7E6_9GAMM|nr:hypothetical protein [Steroidobacter agaridevorans]GFE78542.1 hypothetical protein GCM10011487_05420 [Steroidobacter agaridevorans]